MKNIFVTSILLSTLLFTATSAMAQTVVKLDPSHTNASFTVSHLTISKVSGEIPLATSKLTLSDSGIPISTQATFDLRQLATHDAKRDADLQTNKWFDTAHYSSLSFASTVITPGLNNTFTMKGLLTFHGVTRPVVLNGSYNGSAKDPMGQTHLGFSATTTIDRTAWGVGNAPAALVGNDIAITIQAEALKH